MTRTDIMWIRSKIVKGESIRYKTVETKPTFARMAFTVMKI